MERTGEAYGKWYISLQVKEVIEFNKLENIQNCWDRKCHDHIIIWYDIIILIHYYCCSVDTSF